MAGYLTLEEAAERLGVEYKTVYRLVRSGEIPAGKVGRIYRIREEDLDGYFERQKRMVAEQAGRTGLTAVEGRLCGACGNQILSELSVGGNCSECGKPICQACWAIHKRRVCEAHSEPQGKAHGPAEKPEPTERSPSKRKRQERPDEPRESRDRTVERLRQEGKPVVTTAEARLAEQTFLRAFGQRFDSVEQLPEPLSGITIPLRKARVKHELAASSRLDGALPRNRTSRFVLRSGGWGKPKACLVVEARFVARPEVLRKQGYDAVPMDEAELEACLNGLGREKTRGECFRFVLIASPTGWSEAARAIVAKRTSGKAFRDRRTAVALCDLHGDQVFLDDTDERLRPLWPVLAPGRYENAIAECVGTIHEALVDKGSLSLDAAAELCSADPDWVRAAFNELARDGQHELDELPDIGLVISRKTV